MFRRRISASATAPAFLLLFCLLCLLFNLCLPPSVQAQTFEEHGISIEIPVPWRLESPAKTEDSELLLHLLHRPQHKELNYGTASLSIHDFFNYKDVAMLRDINFILNGSMENPLLLSNQQQNTEHNLQDMMQHFLRSFAEGPLRDGVERHSTGSVPALLHCEASEPHANGNISYKAVCFYLLTNDRLARFAGQGEGSQQDFQNLKKAMLSLRFNGEKWRKNEVKELITDSYKLDLPPEWRVRTHFEGRDVNCHACTLDANQDVTAAVLVLSPDTFTPPSVDLKRFLASGSESYINEMFKKGNTIKILSGTKSKSTTFNGIPATRTTAWLKLEHTGKVFMDVLQLRIKGKNIFILSGYNRLGRHAAKADMASILKSFRPVPQPTGAQKQAR